MGKNDSRPVTRDEVLGRGEIVANVHYELRLSLSPGQTYAGVVKVDFEVSRDDFPLWLDYNGRTVSEVMINGVSCKVNYERGRVGLPSLPCGNNTVLVVFHNEYSNDGFGFHRFQDPGDNKVYLYTQFSPFQANRMFPCFDQPNIKGLFDLTVKAPQSWVVISTEPGKIIGNETSMPILEQNSEFYEETVHFFEGKYRISTYVFAIIAGEYSEFSDISYPASISDTANNIPIRFFCMNRSASYFNAQIYMPWLTSGLSFFQSFFSTPFPFSKYDCVFIPDSRYEAMENVGCLTYSDRFIFRRPPNNEELLQACSIFLHEMAHMWFGNLVTMKWWDDLWLKESFATITAYLAIEAELTQLFPSVWTNFCNYKDWGYNTDANLSTHPMSRVVKDTDEARKNFDGIAYSKGAAVLRQLSAVIGKENFRKGIIRFLQRFRFSNAEFNDFVTVFTEVVGENGCRENVEEWAEMWIRTAGLNKLEAKVEYFEAKISKFSVIQAPVLGLHPTLRRHRINVEVYDENMRVLAKEMVDVLPQYETDFELFIGLPGKVVILNVDDWGYCKIKIDKETRKIISKKKFEIADRLTATLINKALD
jgi:aminopeptidase N